ncbi:hypothetical protein [Thermodesulfovibrio aggregans]|nr:hypothetical protein [Thermodesulfovibrio aggregans]
MEDWATIRNLKKKNPEHGTRAIAKLLGGYSACNFRKKLLNFCYR